MILNFLDKKIEIEIGEKKIEIEIVYKIENPVAEELKTAKYVCLTDKGYIFQPVNGHLAQCYLA